MYIKDEFKSAAIECALSLIGIDYNPENGQMKRHGLRGPFTMTGGKEIRVFLESKTPKVVSIDGKKYVQSGLGVSYRPNFGKKKIYFYITLNEGTDEWSFYVQKVWGFNSEVLRAYEGLPLENIQDTINSTYDELIKSECQGFIPC